jgi:uncharacterized protein
MNRPDRSRPPLAAIPFVSDLAGQARLAALALWEFGEGLFNPTVRLGVTGLSRAGKTVFITALVHGLVRGGRFPVFDAHATGRIAGAQLAPQPDDAVPRFDYERHLRALIDERRWPDSTRQIGELRVTIDYQSASGAMRKLTLDIVDYPGEWLLDLPLLHKSYERWAAESLAQSRVGSRREPAAAWHAHMAGVDPLAPADEQWAIKSAELFTGYLRACREERYAMSLLPPGRFLIPGDLEGSPALTFAPLDLPPAAVAAGSVSSRSNWGMMRRRYNAYVDVVVRPFFREHFARLDRQIVLVDALAAFNAGPEALRDLQGALDAIMECFKIGRNRLIGAMFNPRIDKILFAATKADHLHQSEHDRLEAILRRMTERAIAKAGDSGAAVDVIALSAVRATREGRLHGDDTSLPAIVGTAVPGETAGGRAFDGSQEIAVFPGDLPEASTVFEGGAPAFGDLRFVRFRPPALEADAEGNAALPHIRLDRALQFLIGDRLA